MLLHPAPSARLLPVMDGAVGPSRASLPVNTLLQCHFHFPNQILNFIKQCRWATKMLLRPSAAFLINHQALH